MTDIISTLLSRAPRYNIKSDSDLTVTIQTEGASDSIEAELVNISAGGARFKVSQAIQANEILTATIEAKERNRKIVVSGKICWSKLAAGGDWCLGCSLTPPIPEEVLNEFAEDGTLERREHQREQMSLRTTVQWELNNESASAWVLNYSRSGFCLLSQFAGKPGERVRLQLELDDGQVIEVRGRIQWQVESQEGFVAGCKFLESRDFAILRDLATSKVPKKRVSSRRRWSGIIAASTVLLLCIAISRSPLSSMVTQQSFDQGADSTDSLAAKSSLVQLEGSNGSDIGQDVTQAVRPAVTRGSPFQEVAGPTENAGQQESVPYGYRTWLDSTGQYRVVARVVNVESNIVRLRTENGQNWLIPLDRLSRDDARFVALNSAPK